MNLERMDKLIAAARAWREFQYSDSLLDQKTDVRLRHQAEYARDELLTEIDMLENEPADSADAICRVAYLREQDRRVELDLPRDAETVRDAQ